MLQLRSVAVVVIVRIVSKNKVNVSEGGKVTLVVTCRAMDDPCVSVEQKKTLLRKACDRHQALYRDAMNGKGIDRHMFGLFVVSKGYGYVRVSVL